MLEKSKLLQAFMMSQLSRNTSVNVKIYTQNISGNIVIDLDSCFVDCSHICTCVHV